ncbi:tetratricopeptide repeat protein [Thiosulfativibrio zosterae]|uniref:Uncharacterized protein n=1 Tax=Thiosulfativibrio zosterae TaxID=2675053 RepID=A0A6F8PPR9_9GAMM|nr:tetratricopeptide repeat protein [Thiosulfativibrio zosterae]BBP44076.1 hypothetical protein THMIRHAT_18220 [Thiosulfativibrio zosterae]
MSALLEALKKAAEEKTKQKSVLSQDTPDAVKDTKTGSDQNFNLSLTAETNANATKPQDTLPASSAPLNLFELNLNDSSDQSDQASPVTEQLNEVDGNTSDKRSNESNEEDQLEETIPFSLVDHDEVATSKEIADDLDPPVSEPAISFEIMPVNNHEEELKSAPLVPDIEVEESIKTSETLVDAYSHEDHLKEEASLPIENDEQALPEKPKLTDTSDFSSSSTHSTTEVEKPTVDRVSILDKEQVDDFDWSLANIPVYKQQVSPEQASTSGKILKGLEKSSSKAPSIRSKMLLIVLLILLVLTGIVFYLMTYYEEQKVTAQQSLNRFNLPAKSNAELPKSDKSQKDEMSKPADGPAATDSKQDNPVLDSDDAQVQQVITKFEFVPSEPPVKTIEVIKNNTPVKAAPKPVKKDKSSLVIDSKPNISNEQIAYEAYLNHDYSVAKLYYQKALDENPKAFASLFGLGAIAVHEKNNQKAFEYYQRAEQIDPNHPKLQVALTALRAAAGNYEDWSEVLKSQINKNPQDATLYFSLGNLYVKRKDWVNAQENFFKALELAPDNMQFALNLAISLDHLGQYRLAIRYYQKALVLASERNPLPSSAQVKSRILAIQQFLRAEK